MEALLHTLLGAAIAVALAGLGSRFFGFRAQTPADYAGQAPDFDLRKHLRGRFLCEGVIYGPTGRVASRFVAEMEARWDGDVGVLREDFRHDSGARQSREWRLTLAADGAIRAEADDLVGAGRGAQAGPAAMLTYRIKLPEASGGHVLDATDWLYLMETGAILNRSKFRKWGIPVAELVATIRRKEAA